MNYEEARKMYEDYNCNEYNMKIDGVLSTYKSYNVPIEVQEKWKILFIQKKYEKVLYEKDLYSLNLLSSFSKSSVEMDLLIKIYEIYLTQKQQEDWFFLSKICCALINSINLFHIKKDPSFIVKLIEELMFTMNDLNYKMENNEYINKIFEENDSLEQTKKLLERYRKEALKIKEKAL